MEDIEKQVYAMNLEMCEHFNKHPVLTKKDFIDLLAKHNLGE